MDLDIGSDKKHKIAIHLIRVKACLRRIRTFAVIEKEDKVSIK